MAFGPVQLLALGFEHPDFRGEGLAELRRLAEHDVVRLIDLLVVAKDDDGHVSKLEVSDVPELEEFGALAGALIGLGAAGEEGAEVGAELGAEKMAGGKMYSDEDVWVLADQIPPGVTTVIALLEHRWAIPLREAIQRAGGMAYVDEWVHPEDLVRYGLEMAE